MSTPSPTPISCIDYVKLIYPLPISPPVLGIAKGMCAAGVPRLVVALIVLEMILGGSKKRNASDSEQEKWDRLTEGATRKPPSSSLEAQMQKLELFNLFEFSEWEEAIRHLEDKFPDFDQTLLSRLYARACIGHALTKEVIDFEISEHRKMATHIQALASSSGSAPSTPSP